VVQDSKVGERDVGMLVGWVWGSVAREVEGLWGRVEEGMRGLGRGESVAFGVWCSGWLLIGGGMMLMLLGSCGDGGEDFAVEDEDVVYEEEKRETARLEGNPFSVGGFVLVRC